MPLEAGLSDQGLLGCTIAITDLPAYSSLEQFAQDMQTTNVPSPVSATALSGSDGLANETERNEIASMNLQLPLMPAQKDFLIRNLKQLAKKRQFRLPPALEKLDNGTHDHPVLKIRGHRDLVVRPVDLRTISDKLNQDQYSSAKSFADDLLIVANDSIGPDLMSSEHVQAYVESWMQDLPDASKVFKGKRKRFNYDEELPWPKKSPTKKTPTDYRSQVEQSRLEYKTPPGKTRPRDVIENLIQYHKDTYNIAYANGLKLLSIEPLTESQKSQLNEASTLGPNYLGRTASRTAGFESNKFEDAANGWTTGKIMLSAADVNKGESLHDNMTDMSQGAAAYMLGNHLIWMDGRDDGFLSCSQSFIFLLIHALKRLNEGQGSVMIQIFDRRQAKDREGNPAKFYPSSDLLKIFEVAKWPGWSTHARKDLHPRFGTQEWILYGTITLDDTMLQPALIEKLIKDGLYKLYPFLAIPRNHERVGLYAGQVEARKAGYPPLENGPSLYSYNSKPVLLTVEVLELVRKITMNFMKVPEGVDAHTVQPHLHIFLGFLTLEKRQQSDPILMEWISKYYIASNVLDLYMTPDGKVCPGFTFVANNLPECMQHLDLIRDCIALFALPVQLPDNVVSEAHAFNGYRLNGGNPWDHRYAGCDFKQNKKNEKSRLFNEDAQTDRREKTKLLRQQNKEKKAAVQPGTTSLGPKPAEAPVPLTESTDQDVLGSGPDTTSVESNGAGDVGEDTGVEEVVSEHDATFRTTAEE